MSRLRQLKIGSKPSTTIHAKLNALAGWAPGTGAGRYSQSFGRYTPRHRNRLGTRRLRLVPGEREGGGYYPRTPDRPSGTVGVFDIKLRTGVDIAGIPLEEHLFMAVVPGLVIGIHESIFGDESDEVAAPSKPSAHR